MRNVVILYMYIMYCDQITATGFFLLNYCVKCDIFGDLNSSTSFKICDIYINIYKITYGYRHICLNAVTLLC